MKPVYIREFLNTEGHHELASILVDVDDRGIEFKITDCNRSVRLDFDTYSAKDRANTLHKVAVLNYAIQKLTLAVRQRVREVERRAKGGEDNT